MLHVLHMRLQGDAGAFVFGPLARRFCDAFAINIFSVSLPALFNPAGQALPEPHAQPCSASTKIKLAAWQPAFAD